MLSALTKSTCSNLTNAAHQSELRKNCCGTVRWAQKYWFLVFQSFLSKIKQLPLFILQFTVLKVRNYNQNICFLWFIWSISKRRSSPTCHTGSKQIATGHRLDGDPGLTLEEAGNEQGLHLIHHTWKTGLARHDRRSLEGNLTKVDTNRKALGEGRPPPRLASRGGGKVVAPSCCITWDRAPGESW